GCPRARGRSSAAAASSTSSRCCCGARACSRSPAPAGGGKRGWGARPAPGGGAARRGAPGRARGPEPSYSGGAALVDLAAVSDARVVGDTVAAALDVRALTGQDLVDAVVDFLAPRALLLVLANCEP